MASAFFDLDRTVLLGASGPAFNDVLPKAVPGRVPSLPGL